MQKSLKQDLQRLAGLAYHRLEWCGDFVRELHRLRRSARQHPDFAALETVGAWLFVPFTFWPIDLLSLCALVQQQVGGEAPLEKELRLLVESLPPLPDEKAQAVAAAHEHDVERGGYEPQVKAAEKYRLTEEKLMKNRRFRDEWTAIRTRFDLTEFRNRKGIIRRRMVAERAFRPDWQLNWHEPRARFQAVFDVFCYRWHLYGMEGDRPLLMQVTVNLTPHGTMIVIPAWWSFDYARDLNWPVIKKLHNARVPSKQGAKLTRNQMEQDAEAEKAARLDAKARTNGLKGERRETWVMEQMRWVDEDSRRLRRVLSRAKRLKI